MGSQGASGFDALTRFLMARVRRFLGGLIQVENLFNAFRHNVNRNSVGICGTVQDMSSLNQSLSARPTLAFPHQPNNLAIGLPMSVIGTGRSPS